MNQYYSKRKILHCCYWASALNSEKKFNDEYTTFKKKTFSLILRAFLIYFVRVITINLNTCAVL